MLPGWTFLPIAFASLLTGAMAALFVLALTILSYPRPFADMLGVEFILGLVTVTFFGLAVGLIAVLPIAMILSAIGIRQAMRRKWVAYRRTWAATGFLVGATTLLVPSLLSNDNNPFVTIAIFGGACGLTAALLCHRFLEIGRAG